MVCVPRDENGDAGASVDAAIGSRQGRAVCVGGSAACAVRGGRVYCWGGWNLEGVHGTGVSSETPYVRPWRPAQLPFDAVSHLACGESHVCASNGADAYCWGAGGNAEVLGHSNGPLPGLSGRTSTVSAGSAHACGNGSAGPLCWGENDVDLSFGIDGPIDGRLGHQMPGGVAATAGRFGGAVEIVCGGASTCIVTTTGVECVGLNARGVTGAIEPNPDPEGRPIPGIDAQPEDLMAGRYHACAIVAGVIRCWGADNFHQLGRAVTASSICGGFECDPEARPVQLGGDLDGTRFVRLSRSSSSNTTCAVTAGSGQVVCWGANHLGQTGNAPTPGHPSLSSLVRSEGGPLEGIIDVACAFESCCAIDIAGRTWCWGANRLGILGNGSTDPDGTASPHPMATEVDFSMIE